MSLQMRMHDRVVREAIAENEGRVFKGLGDGFCAVFPRVSNALSAAISIHDRMESAEWNRLNPLRLRMAIHCGTAEERDDDYFGPTVNRAARLLSVALPGQLLLSQASHALVEDNLPAGARAAALGKRRLRGLARKEQVYAYALAQQPPAGRGLRLGKSDILLPRRRLRVALVIVSAVGVMAVAVGVISALQGRRSPSPSGAVVRVGFGSGMWSEDGHDPAHTGFNPTETLLGPGNVSRLRRAWQAQTPGAARPSVWSAVTVSQGRVYAGSNLGTWAFDEANGTVLWHDAWTGNTEASGPCVAAGRLLIGNARGELYVINPVNGNRIWAWQTQPQVSQHVALTSPSANGDVVYVGSFGDGTVALLAGVNELWTADSGTHTTSPTVVGNTVWLGSSDGVQALEAATGAGRPTWGARFSPPSQTFTAPTVSGGFVYVAASRPGHGGRSGILYDLNRYNGSAVWRFPLAGDRSLPLSQPAVGDGFVYVVSSRGLVSRLDARTGQRSWTFPSSGAPPSREFFWWRPSLANGVLYVGGVGPRREVLFALDAVTGVKLWSHDWPEPFPGREVSSSEPAVAGRWVFVSSSYNERGPSKSAAGVYAFALGRQAIHSHSQR